MVTWRGRDRSSGDGRERHRKRGPSQRTLAQAVEQLEARTLMSVSPNDVQGVLWNGAMVEAMRDEYVLRMPQLNVARSKHISDVMVRTPRVPAGWTVDSLGMGFFKLTAPGASQQLVSAWAQRQMARYIEPNVIRRAAAVPNDVLYSATENWAFRKIEAEEGWDRGTGDGSTIVALLDTGVDDTHPDLSTRMWQDPSSGFAGFNAFNRSAPPMDDNGHGTFAAGIVGAVGNNGVGIAGMSWDVQMMAVKVLDSNGLGTTDRILAGLGYVASQIADGNPISTVHCGFARNVERSQAEEDALRILESAEVVIVCAAGNDRNDNDLNNRYPASFDITTLISVAASDENDALADFSNFGASSVHLAAPGVDILSLRAAAADEPPFYPFGGSPYYSVAGDRPASGTSFASAFVAGAAGLMKMLKPSASAVEIRSAILEGVDEVSTLSGKVATGGRLNLAKAVEILLATDAEFPEASFKTGQATQVVEGDIGFSYMDVTVVLDRPPDSGQAAVVAYETRRTGTAFENQDFVKQSGSLIFSAGQTERTLRVRIATDRVAELNENFTVALVQERSRGVVATDTVSLTIVDDDYEQRPQVAPPTEVLVPRAQIARLQDENGDDLPVREGDFAQFVIYLDRVSDKLVTVRYRTHEPAIRPIEFAAAGIDYHHAMGSVTFRPGEVRKVISVRTILDAEPEVIDPLTNRQRLDGESNPQPELFNVLLYDPINAVVGGANSIAVGEIIDVVPGVSVPPTPTFTPPTSGTNPAGTPLPGTVGSPAVPGVTPITRAPVTRTPITVQAPATEPPVRLPITRLPPTR